jgi:glycosyltransferase involved in cell wall biosynthesis
MKILLIMDPGIPVPPQLYGGIERIVYLLANQYIKNGHTVTLLAGPGSYCNGETVIYGTNGNCSSIDRYGNVITVWKYLLRRKNQFDLIHNFGRLIYLLPILNHPVKKIMSYQRPVTQKGIRLVNSLPNKNIMFTACSKYCVSTGNVAGNWRAIYNGVDFSSYQLAPTVDVDAPLMFLGRLDKVKGAHTAIRVAKATGNTLILAGNIPDTPDNLQYYKTEIEPLIDNNQIKYIGALNDAEKNKWLQQAKALLFPIEWDEPFGIVMIEAMACGTPVIAFERGSVPEVVENGTTGFIVNNEEEMIKKLGEIESIDRTQCREAAKKRFDISTIAAEYLLV